VASDREKQLATALTAWREANAAIRRELDDSDDGVVDSVYEALVEATHALYAEVPDGAATELTTLLEHEEDALRDLRRALTAMARAQAGIRKARARTEEATRKWLR
jgi:hypothetical protein